MKFQTPIPLRAAALVLLVAVTGSPAQAETIRWFSVAESANLTSSGGAMTGGFSFELGVFNGNFVPTASNTALWAANWVPAQRVAYNGPNRRFDGQFTVTSNASPFTVGKAAYVWGFRGGIESSDWILFRAPSWTWPAPNPRNPFGLDWDAAAATAVIGSVNAAGNPFLAKASKVVDAASPTTTWQQWRDTELAGAAGNKPDDDPDHDGSSNILEFVFGTPPTQPGKFPSISQEITAVSSQRFLQLKVPRRVDHPATLTVEVSPDLKAWSSGPDATAVVSDTPAGLVIRDLTPIGPAAPTRFVRIKAEIATP